MTAAYTLERETDFLITLFEGANRLGGVIKTEREDGYLVEHGPDSLFTGKSEALELVRELDLEDHLIEPSASGFSILVGDRLFPVPSGLVSLSGVDPTAIRQAEFLSEAAKERALEPTVDPLEADDPSIADYFTHRFGHEFSELVAEPLLAGTHAGDPHCLSMKALFPRLWNQEKPAGGRSMFVTLREGMEGLVARLVASLERTNINVGESVERIEPLKRGYRLWPDGQEVDALMLAVPARMAAKVVQGISVAAADLLMQTPYASSRIVTAAYRSDQLSKPLCGTGFLVPPSAGSALTGCTWSSNKWEGRAPADRALIRFFFRGDMTEGELSEKQKSAASIVGINGEPEKLLVSDWPNAFPQYTLGHLDRVQRIEHELKPLNILVAGSSYRGVGIPDCIRQGRETAREITELLA